MNKKWNEREHPRNPHTGEFVEKSGGGGWAQGVVSALLGRPRRDLRDELSDRDYEAIAVTASKHKPNTGDPMLGEIYERQGYHTQLPEVVTRDELDRAVAQGWTRLSRGVKPAFMNTTNIYVVPAGELTRQFRSGDHHFPGQGIYGNGTYTTTNRDTANAFAEYQADGVLDMALSPDARVIEYDNLVDEWHKMAPRFSARYEAAQQAAGVGPDSWVWGYSDPESTVLSDMGRLAAAMGYDAMVVRANHQYRPLSSRGMGITGPGGEDYYVVFNRGVLKVEGQQ